jgi:spectinomycin phosphotransferase
VPHFLHEQGVSQIISPLKTREGWLWTTLDSYTCILYPFVAGHNGFQAPLTREQWVELGAALRRVHAVTLPPSLRRQIPSETFAAIWRKRVRGFLEAADKQTYTDPVAAKMAAVLREHRDEIAFVVARAEALAAMLQSQPVAQVLCHTDIHAGNLLLEANGALHLIDWDDPMLAPKERDLMFIGGGVGGVWTTAAEEVLFYQGYGKADVNLTALTYYRYERIVADIAAFSEQILETTAGGADRERSFQKFLPIFRPNQVLEIAYQTDRILKARDSSSGAI